MDKLIVIHFHYPVECAPVAVEITPVKFRAFVEFSAFVDIQVLTSFFISIYLVVYK